MTTTHPDTQDLFVERLDPADPARYLTPGGSAVFTTRSEVIRSGGRSIEHLVRSTRHGPVVSDAMGGAAAAADAGTVLALDSPVQREDARSEGRRVGEEGGGTCRYRWLPY